MKTLILCVDRDDDLGQKAGLQTPIVGRRANVEAATALGLKDPEDSDTNAIFAAVRLYDQEKDTILAQGGQIEVATICGHKRVGLRSDRKLAQELDQVLEQSRADEVILVSDGAEDEQIMPVLQSRVRVAHVHRSVVKQVPRLEGFYHILTRMLDDKRIAQRYILPLSIVFLVWALSVFVGAWTLAVGLTLLISGVWLMVHALRWEDRVESFFREFAEGIRRPTLKLVANLVMMLLLVVGGVQAWQAIEGSDASLVLQGLQFIDAFLLYFLSAWLVRIAGLLFDEYMQSGQASIGHWTTAFTLISLGFIGSVAVDVAIALVADQPMAELLRLDLMVRLLVGLLVAASGIIVGKYIRNFFRDAPVGRPQ